MRVELRAQVEIALGAAQRAVELTKILRIGVAVNHHADHEGRVENLAVTELLGEVIRSAKQVHRRRRTVEQLVHAGEQHPVGIDQIHFGLRHELLERLHRRVVAARLIADRDRHAGKVLRGFDLGIRLHENAGRRHRIDVARHAAEALRGGHVDGPVAGAAHVGAAALLERLEGADLVAFVVMLAVGGFDQLAKFVVETFLGEIALVVGDPFLQAEVRFDQEFRHGSYSAWRR
jgi:hypothetical protein